MTSFFSRLVSRFFSTQHKTPTLSSYGQNASSGPPQTIQAVIEWLMLSLMQCNYFGTAHLFWMDPDDTPILIKEIRQAIRRQEPVFMYRCGDRAPAPLEGHYWRMMPEHRSMRIYQLELKED